MSRDDADRYAGRPFVRLLDCFVLWAIGELPADQAAQLTEITPNLQRVYGSTGTWQEIVAEQMDIGETLPGKLRTMWERNTELARQRRERLSAQDWARAVVDQNFI